MSPTKSIRSIFHLPSSASSIFHPKCGHRHEGSPERATDLPRQLSVSAGKMEENINRAEEIIAKWDPEACAYAKITSLFYEDREEARQFVAAVEDLQHSMQSAMSDSAVSGAQFIVRGQRLMRAAMRCLEKEFHQILSANRDRLDPESVAASKRSSLSLKYTSSSDHEEDEIHISHETIGRVEGVTLLAMDDLRAIAECMISCGYGKECVDTYKTIRRTIVEEGLYKLGFDRLSPAQIQKLDWDTLGLRIRNWLTASKVAVRTLFAGERALCDHVFSSFSSISESAFAEIARDPAIYFLGFPELVAQKAKATPDKAFRLLDMFNSIVELLPVIESIFSHSTTAAVHTQATSSLTRLGEAVRGLLSTFEATINKDVSKAPVPGGAVHPLTRYTMNYLIILADYREILTEIYFDEPLRVPSSLPEPLFDARSGTSSPPSPTYRSEVSFTSTISPRFAWLLLVLLCKLDSKAEAYHEVPLAYLFLANNLHYVVNKVCQSPLKGILGDEWILKNESKVRNYARSYERMAWGRVIAAAAPLPPNQSGPDAAKEALRRFNKAFADACKQQVSWIVSDEKMREELKLSVTCKVIPAYKDLHHAASKVLRGERDLSSVLQFTADDISNYISDLFSGDVSSAANTMSLSDSSKWSWVASSPVSSPRVSS